MLLATTASVPPISVRVSGRVHRPIRLDANVKRCAPQCVNASKLIAVMVCPLSQLAQMSPAELACGGRKGHLQVGQR